MSNHNINNRNSLQNMNFNRNDLTPDDNNVKRNQRNA